MTRRQQSETLHEQVERIAIPTFDWVSEPIEAIAKGLVLHSRANSPSGVRPHGGEEPDEAKTAPSEPGKRRRWHYRDSTSR
jgi:hypothetical protein